MTTGPRDDDRSIDERFADIVAHWDAPPAPGAHPRPPGHVDDVPRDHDPDDEDPARDVHPAPGHPGPRPSDGARDTAPDTDDADDAFPGVGPGSAAARQPLPPPPTSGWRVHTPPEDDEDEGYVPPPPAPLPRHDWMFWGALVGLVVGPVWLVYLVVVEGAVNRTPMWLAGGLVVAGFGLLVARLPARRSPDDDDDGARV